MSKTVTTAEIEAWIVGRVSEYGEIDPATFDASTALADLGFDSVYALTLCGDIEDEFEVEVEPSIVWDHPKIDQLAQAVHGLIAAG